MEKVDLEDIISLVCESIGKSKRFSELSHLELCDLWKGICKYLCEQLSQKKSINLHGIGSFYTKKSKRVTGDTGIVWTILFSPSKTWDKLPGYSIDRTVATGTLAAEPLNLAAVAVLVGFTRELVEAGVKDIVNGLTKILRAGTAVSLSMGNLGKLNFQNNEIKFRFISNFIRNLNDEGFVVKQKKPVEAPVETITTSHDEKPSSNSSNAAPKLTPAPAPADDAKQETSDLPPKPPSPIKLAPVEKQIETISDADRETKALTLDLDEAARKLANLEQLIGQTFTKENKTEQMHTHYYTGNRLWNNNKCPICKTEAMKNVVDLQAIKKADKENDKMLLHISLEIDKEYMDKKNAHDLKRQLNSIEAAQYNHRVSIESQEKLGFKEKQPMGDLFEKRKIQKPIMSPEQMASGIQEQIHAKRERNERSANMHALQDKLVCEKLRKEIKAAELQAHLSKTQKAQHMHASLAEQIKVNKTLKEKEDADPTDNPFARSESLMALYQREKAKQLYYEQLAIVRQKRDYAHKLGDVEQKHSLTRVDVARRELHRDLKTIKNEKVEMRRSLERYWADQLLWKKKMAQQEAELDQ